VLAFGTAAGEAAMHAIAAAAAAAAASWCAWCRRLPGIWWRCTAAAAAAAALSSIAVRLAGAVRLLLAAKQDRLLLQRLQLPLLGLDLLLQGLLLALQLRQGFAGAAAELRLALLQLLQGLSRHLRRTWTRVQHCFSCAYCSASCSPFINLHLQLANRGLKRFKVAAELGRAECPVQTL
jgi:hypothetical protein